MVIPPLQRSTVTMDTDGDGNLKLLIALPVQPELLDRSAWAVASVVRISHYVKIAPLQFTPVPAPRARH